MDYFGLNFIMEIPISIFVKFDLTLAHTMDFTVQKNAFQNPELKSFPINQINLSKHYLYPSSWNTSFLIRNLKCRLRSNKIIWPLWDICSLCMAKVWEGRWKLHFSPPVSRHNRSCRQSVQRWVKCDSASLRVMMNWIYWICITMWIR